MEVIANVDTVVFGKTGTLTEAHASVVGIQTTHTRISTTQVLTYAACAEQELDHPLAKAIVRYAEENDVQLRKCEAWQYQVGMGISTQIDGKKILVGSDRYLLQAGVDVTDELIYRQHPHLKTESHCLVYVASDGKLLGETRDLSRSKD